MESTYLKDKTYLGDAVYCGHDTYQIWIYTSNGIEEENFVALEPSVLEAFVQYIERINKVEETK